MFEPQTKFGNDQAPNPNAVTTVVTPGATELHLMQLLSQLRQLNSGELELTTTLQQHYLGLLNPRIMTGTFGSVLSVSG